MIPDSSDHVPRGVLIVEQSPESREVLRTVLQQRGFSTFEANGARQGLELARRHQPAVIVLDLDSDGADDAMVRQAYDRQTSQDQAALVILGTSSPSPRDASSPAEFAKPYHYAPLVRRIMELAERPRSHRDGQ